MVIEPVETMLPPIGLRDRAGEGRVAALRADIAGEGVADRGGREDDVAVIAGCAGELGVGVNAAGVQLADIDDHVGADIGGERGVADAIGGDRWPCRDQSDSVTRVSALTLVDEVWRPRICA